MRNDSHGAVLIEDRHSKSSIRWFQHLIDIPRNASLSLVMLSLLVVGSSGCRMLRQPAPRISEANRVHYITYKVQRSGETLGAISARHTGSSAKWRAIVAANPGMDVRRIKVGDIIKIPTSLLKPSIRSVKQIAVVSPSSGQRKKTVIPREPKKKKGTEEIEVRLEARQAPPLAEGHSVIRDPVVRSVVETPIPPPYNESIRPLAVPQVTLSPIPKATIDPHRAEEQRLKKRYEVLMDLIEKGEATPLGELGSSP